MAKYSKLTADELRAEREKCQRAWIVGAVDPKRPYQVSAEVREIDDELQARGEKSW